MEAEIPHLPDLKQGEEETKAACSAATAASGRTWSVFGWGWDVLKAWGSIEQSRRMTEACNPFFAPQGQLLLPW